MCVNQKCMAVESLRQGISCPNNCNDNGVCNSLGHCHCNKGFAPPLCDYPGTGGSIDSGPAPDPQVNFFIPLQIIFYSLFQCFIPYTIYFKFI